MEEYGTNNKKQYYLNLLRQPTVILLTPHLIKRSVLVPIYYEYREKKISMELINTKLLKQVIKNTKYSIISNSVNNHLVISTLTKQLTMEELLLLKNELSTNFTFICALVEGQIITSARINFINSNFHKNFYPILATYLLSFVFILKNKARNNYTTNKNSYKTA